MDLKWAKNVFWVLGERFYFLGYLSLVSLTFQLIRREVLDRAKVDWTDYSCLMLDDGWMRGVVVVVIII